MTRKTLLEAKKDDAPLPLGTLNGTDFPSGPIACALRQILLSSLALSLPWWKSLVSTGIFSKSSLKLQ